MDNNLSYLEKLQICVWYEDLVTLLRQGKGGPEPSKWSSNRYKNTVRKSLRFQLMPGALHYVEIDDSLARCIMPEDVPKVLGWAHDDHGHYSDIITLQKLRGRYFWPRRTADLRHFVASCRTCQQAASAKEHGPYQRFTTFRPMAIFGMDFMGPISPASLAGDKYILIGVDYSPDSSSLKS